MNTSAIWHAWNPRRWRDQPPRSLPCWTKAPGRSKPGSSSSGNRRHIWSIWRGVGTTTSWPTTRASNSMAISLRSSSSHWRGCYACNIALLTCSGRARVKAASVTATIAKPPLWVAPSGEGKPYSPLFMASNSRTARVPVSRQVISRVWVTGPGGWESVPTRASTTSRHGTGSRFPHPIRKTSPAPRQSAVQRESPAQRKSPARLQTRLKHQARLPTAWVSRTLPGMTPM